MKFKIHLIWLILIFFSHFSLANFKSKHKLNIDKGFNHEVETNEPNDIFEFDITTGRWIKIDKNNTKINKIKNFSKIGFDPVRFKLFTRKDSIRLGEEIEIEISADFLNVNPNQMFQFEGQNEFTIRLVTPEGFIITGGDYYDYIQGFVNNNKPTQKYLVKGYFNKYPENQVFKLLRGESNSDYSSLFVLKDEIEILFYENRPTITSLKSNGIKDDKLKISKAKEVKLVTTDCNILSPIITESQFFCNTLSVTASCSNGFVTWSNGIMGSNSSSQIITQTVALYATCTSYTNPNCKETSVSKFYTKLDPLVSPSISANSLEICSGSTTYLTASGCGSNTTKWSNGLTGTSITVGVGSYFAFCLNSCGQSGNSNSLSISNYAAPSQPSVTSSGLICVQGGTTTLTANCSGTAFWYNTSMNYLGSGNSYSANAGNYLVRCEHRNCSSLFSSVVNFIVSQNSPPSQVNPTNYSICSGTTTDITNKYTGCGGGTVTWPGVANPAIVGPGSYTAYCSNQCGSNYATLTIGTLSLNACGGCPAPTSLSYYSKVICPYESISLPSSNCTFGTISWSPSNIDNITIGTKTYTGTCVRAGCSPSGSVNITVTVVANPEIPILTNVTSSGTVTDIGGGNKRITACIGTTLNISGVNCGANETITWYPSLPSVMPANPSPNYYARCKRNNSPNCEGGGSSYIILNPVANPNEPSITPTSPLTICSGNSATIAATCAGGNTVIWNDISTFETSRIITPLISTTYFASCKSSNNCTSSQASKIVNVNQTPIGSVIAKNICAGETLYLQTTNNLPNENYVWTFNGVNVPAERLNAQPNISGTYSVTMSANGCTKNSSGLMNVNPVPVLTGSSVDACGVITIAGSGINLTEVKLFLGPNEIQSYAFPSSNILNGTFILQALSNPGLYSINTKNQFGCVSSKVQPLEYGSVNLSAKINSTPTSDINITVCQGNTVTLTASPCPAGYTLNWPDGLQIGELSRTFYSGQLNNYAVSCKKTCPSNILTLNSNSFNILIINPAPPTSISSKTICSGSFVDLGGACPSGEIIWYRASDNTALTSSTINPSTTTSYYAKCKEVGTPTCLSVASSTITITVNPSPIATASSNFVANTTSGGCALNNGYPKVGQTLNLYGSCGGAVPTWTGPNGFSSSSLSPIISATINATGSYTLNCRAANACVTSASTSVTVYPTCQLTFTTVPTACVSGVSSVELTVCNRNPALILVYQLEKKDINGNFIIVRPYSPTTILTANAAGKFEINGINDPAIYRVKILERTSFEIPLSSGTCESAYSQELDLNCPCTSNGKISYERWHNTNISTVEQLLASGVLNKSPNTTLNLDVFEAPYNQGENFSARIHGYICPPVTGAYRFQISGSNATQLYISTNDSPLNIGTSPIAFNTIGTGHRTYTTYPGQTSGEIILQANKKYYVMALMVETGTWDNLSVRWQKPGEPFQGFPIPASGTLSNYNGCYIRVNSNVANNTVEAGNSITLNASGGNSGSPIYQWWANGSLVATGSSFTTIPSINTTYTTICTNCINCLNARTNVIVNSPGCYKITANFSNKALYIENSEDGALIKQRTATNSVDEIWKKELQTDGRYILRAYSNNKIIVSTDGGYELNMFNQGTGITQSWNLENTSGNLFRIMNGGYNGFNIPAEQTEDGVAIKLTSPEYTHEFRIEQITCPAANCVTDKKVSYERWNGIAGTNVSDLTTNPRYTSNQAPDLLTYADLTSTGLNIVTSFPSQTDPDYDKNVYNLTNFGARIKGYLCPPLLGTKAYTFNLYADNTAEFSITDKFGVVKFVSKTDPDNHSTPAILSNVELEGGQLYLFQILQKQGPSASQVKVEWGAPGLAMSVIPGVNIKSFTIVPTPTICGFEIKDEKGNAFPESIALGDYLNLNGTISVGLPADTFIWEVKTTPTIQNDLFTSLTGTGTATLEANPIFIKPSTLGTKNYKVKLKNQPTCFKEYTLEVKDVDCNCEHATLEPSWQGETISNNANFTDNAFNNIVENTYLAPTTSVNGTTEIMQKITYIDGLGRVSQIVEKGASPTGKDMVLPINYDQFGRQTTKYLPYTTNGVNSQIEPNLAITQQTSFYNSLKSDSYAFATTILEASPLQRVLQQGSVGSNWQPNTTNPNIANTIKKTYSWNTNASIKKIVFDITTKLCTIGEYPVDELMVDKTIDEKGRTIEVFYDMLGRAVCNLVYVDAMPIYNYNVYDDFGRIRYKIPPLAAANLANGSSQNLTTIVNLKDLIFIYDYDSKGRLVRYKTPDASAEETIYNPFNQVVLFRNGLHTEKGIWMYTKYDKLGRVESTGIFNSADTRVNLQAQVNNTFLSQAVYGDAAFPTSGFAEKTRSYFDSYPSFVSSSPTAVSGISFDGQLCNTCAVNLTDKLTVSKELIDMPVGSDGTLVPNRELFTVYYYDKYGRTVQVKSDNHLNQQDLNTVQYDWAGRALKNFSTQKLFNNEIYHTKIVNTYDKGLRLKMTTQQINIGAAVGKIQPVGRYFYNEIGEMTQKIQGCNQQAITYSTNIKGWLQNINGTADPSVLLSQKKFFGMTLGYFQENGEIASQSWGTASNLRATSTTNRARTYSYSYDNLSRLKSALFSGGAPGENYSLTGMTYDRNGNILTLQRNFGGNLADNLTYQYFNNQNRLRTVSDSGNESGVPARNNPYFKDGNVTGDDYIYDAAGNLKEDKNRKIVIDYNYLGLPEKVTQNGAGSIYYIYTSTGTKIQKQNAPLPLIGVNTTTYPNSKIDYFAGMVTVGNKLEFVETAEGRALPPLAASTTISATSLLSNYFRYEYQQKDHLGNLRTACRCGEKYDSFGEIIPALITEEPRTLVQENHYDPWGLNLGAIESLTGQKQDWWQFNAMSEKGYLPDGSFVYETAFRGYDPQLGRFMQIDPLADEFPGINPYSFGLNNPISYIDPLGLSPCGGCFPMTMQSFASATLGNAVATSIVSSVITQMVRSNNLPNSITNNLNQTKINTNDLIKKGSVDCECDCFGKPSCDEYYRNLSQYMVVDMLMVFNDLQFVKGAWSLIGGFKNYLIKTFAAKGVTAPKGWITEASKKGGGTVFKDPSNPHNIIRQMPGNPNSPNVLQQSPYVKFMKEGKFYDVNGKVLPNGNVPESHIPLNQFNINNMPKF